MRRALRALGVRRRARRLGGAGRQRRQVVLRRRRAASARAQRDDTPGRRSRPPASRAAAAASPARRPAQQRAQRVRRDLLRPWRCAHRCRRAAARGGVHVAQHDAAGVRAVAVDRGQRPACASRGPCRAPPRAQFAASTRASISVSESMRRCPCARCRRHASRRSAGNRITSRMLGLSVSSIISRSMPMPQPPAGRHAVFERADEVGVVVHRLFVAGFLVRGLRLEARGLVLGVVQLREAVRAPRAR